MQTETKIILAIIIAYATIGEVAAYMILMWALTLKE
jgi:hypothetical protein